MFRAAANWLSVVWVCELVAGFVQPLLGSLSNYDDDHNDDFKTTIDVMTKTTTLHVRHAF